ncbi:hypothetical protein SAMN04488509_1134 [Aquimonas voraii]|uniref:Uncharacterized protein n=2 Tax=Aquimonas voraii TaxID=265719 RepID=A0A1G6Z9H3_9GAMM|nr:hypothetical protein SAMN04488509_1134 [Aquimonas voraii]
MGSKNGVRFTFQSMKRYSAHLLGLVLACSGLACNPSTAAPPSVRIEYVDVERFYALYDATEGWPAADALQTYIDTGSEGLQTLARRRSVTGVRIAEALADRPEIYAAARSCAASLPALRSRLTQVLDRLIELYPKARTPAVTLAIGRGQKRGSGSLSKA